MPRYLINVTVWVYGEDQQSAIDEVEDVLMREISDCELDNSEMIEEQDRESD